MKIPVLPPFSVMVSFIIKAHLLPHVMLVCQRGPGDNEEPENMNKREQRGMKHERTV